MEGEDVQTVRGPVHELHPGLDLGEDVHAARELGPGLVLVEG